MLPRAMVLVCTPSPWRVRASPLPSVRLVSPLAVPVVSVLVLPRAPSVVCTRDTDEDGHAVSPCRLDRARESDDPRGIARDRGDLVARPDGRGDLARVHG